MAATDDRRPKYQRIAGSLREAIRSGESPGLVKAFSAAARLEDQILLDHIVRLVEAKAAEIEAGMSDAGNADVVEDGVPEAAE